MIALLLRSKTSDSLNACKGVKHAWWGHKGDGKRRRYYAHLIAGVEAVGRWAECGLLWKHQPHKFQMLSGPENNLKAHSQVRADVISK